MTNDLDCCELCEFCDEEATMTCAICGEPICDDCDCGDSFPLCPDCEEFNEFEEDDIFEDDDFDLDEDDEEDFDGSSTCICQSCSRKDS